MDTIGDVYENPVIELSVRKENVGDGFTSEGADHISTCSQVVEISFIVESPEVSARDTSSESEADGITVPC